MDNLFWGTLGFIFLTAIISAFIRARQRDECLRLVDDHTVTVTLTDGRTVWGDLRVFARGLQLTYAGPHRTRRGTLKSGYLLYHKEMANILAIARYTGRLTPDEQRARREQIERTFNPGLWGRFKRGWRNVYSTLREAFARALGLVVGRVIKSTDSQVLSQHHKDVEGVGKDVLEAAGEAYEPMLEAHLGQPVILELAPPGGGADRVEIDGYLAEYSEDFVAVFNVEHPAGEAIELTIDPSEASPTLPEGIELKTTAGHVELYNRGRDCVCVQSVARPGESPRQLGATLVRGAHVKFARPDTTFTVRLVRLARVDLVCPRAHATVRYMGPRVDGRHDGIIPLQEDESVQFP